MENEIGIWEFWKVGVERRHIGAGVGVVRGDTWGRKDTHGK